jgi:hypothetical protein
MAAEKGEEVVQRLTPGYQFLKKPSLTAVCVSSSSVRYQILSSISVALHLVTQRLNSITFDEKKEEAGISSLYCRYSKTNPS